LGYPYPLDITLFVWVTDNWGWIVSGHGYG